MCYRTLLDLCLAAATCAGIEQCGQSKNLPSSFPSLAIPRVIWPTQPDIFDAATRQALRRIREDVCLAVFLYVVWMKKHSVRVSSVGAMHRCAPCQNQILQPSISDQKRSSRHVPRANLLHPRMDISRARADEMTHGPK